MISVYTSLTMKKVIIFFITISFLFFSQRIAFAAPPNHQIISTDDSDTNTQTNPTITPTAAITKTPVTQVTNTPTLTPTPTPHIIPTNTPSPFPTNSFEGTEVTPKPMTTIQIETAQATDSLISPTPTGYPIPKRKVLATATSSAVLTQISHAIGFPSDFFLHITPQDIYTPVHISAGETIMLLATAVVFFISGIVLINNEILLKLMQLIDQVKQFYRGKKVQRQFANI